MWRRTIQLIAGQLCHPLLFKDYDVAYKVAENYVTMRIEDSTEECRQYHFDRLSIRMMPEYLVENKNHVWKCQRLPEIITNWAKLKNIKDENFNTFQLLLLFVTSERGIRTPRWNIYASAWGIKDLNKDTITLRDKLNDIKLIPSPVIKQVVY